MNGISVIAWGTISGSGLLAADEAGSISVLQHFVKQGGWITWFVLIPLSILTVALVVHYLLILRRGAQAPSALVRALGASARQGQMRELAESTQDDPTMLGRAVHLGLTQLRAGRDRARAAVEEAVEERATRLFRRIEYLHVIGNVSPMIGLIGTVLGMIRAFSRISEASSGMPEPSKLAGDISLALVTTFWGILIAIPALTAHAVFRNRIDAFASECVRLCEDLFTTMAQQARRVPPSGGQVQAPGPPVSPADRPAASRSVASTNVTE